MSKKTISGDLLNVLGRRGEQIAELALTDFSQFPAPLFNVAFLGDKWPTADLYAELAPVHGRQPVVLFQVKTSASGIKKGARSLSIQVSKRDIQRLNRLPIPAYVLGVCERTKRVFARVVDKQRTTGISRIANTNELTPANLRLLHSEITAWWHQPAQAASHFL